MTKQELFQNAKQLSRKEQIDLAHQIWELAGLGDDLPVTDDQKAELDRRIAEADANPQAPQEWDGLRTKLLRGEV